MLLDSQGATEHELDGQADRTKQNTLEQHRSSQVSERVCGQEVDLVKQEIRVTENST